MTQDVITSGREVRDLVSIGWELWYIHLAPFGYWELRRRNETRRVHWDAIVIIRKRYKQWFLDNTDEEEVGKSWCYRTKQKALAV